MAKSLFGKPRFIPTHVGNIFPASSIRSFHSVHPHACGEHSLFQSLKISSYGSSPRMWGTCLPMRSRTARLRFIPTHVGNIIHGCDCDVYHTVHPHACGEHPKYNSPNSSSAGSSPRMWGTFCLCQCCRPRRRFIPTHVGNILFAIDAIRGFTVHPHACGEHASLALDVSLKAGSSPRMWGTYRIVS